MLSRCIINFLCWSHNVCFIYHIVYIYVKTEGRGSRAVIILILTLLWSLDDGVKSVFRLLLLWPSGKFLFFLSGSFEVSAPNKLSGGSKCRSGFSSGFWSMKYILLMFSFGR